MFSMANKNAIIDGATSFIGYSLALRLCKNDYDVYVVIRSNSSRKYMYENLFSQKLDNRIHIIEGELSNIAAIEKKILDNIGSASIDEYYHVGWSSDFDMPRNNLLGQMMNVEYTLDSLVTAKNLGCQKFVGIGSQAECGLVDSAISSKTPDNPVTAYGKAKCEAYIQCVELSERLGISFYWPRILSAYGPYDRQSTLVMKCINACRNHQVLSMTKAEQMWDYVYVDDVAEALHRICTNGVPQKKYSIASGIGRPLKEYVQIISDVYDYPDLMKGIGKRAYSNQEVMYLVGDVSELYTDTGMKFSNDFMIRIEEMKQRKEDR